MEIAELLAAKKQEILRIAARHGARNVRVFGSVARGEARPGSDVDFRVLTVRLRWAFIFPPAGSEI